jgi:VWFA-related protein
VRRVAALIVGSWALGQEAPFRSEARLVLVQFAVTQGREARLDLKQGDVRVFEGRQEQKIAVFERPGDRERIPLEAAFLLDVSGTVVGNGLLDGRMIAGGFLAGLERGASISVFSFAKRWKKHCEPTRDGTLLEAALREAEREKHDGTRLYGAVAEVAREMGGSKRRAQRALFVVSDGLPDGDTARPEEAVAAAAAAGVRVFPILLRHGGRNRSGDAARDEAMQRELEMRLRAFAALGRETGGRSFDPELGLSRKTMGEILASTASLLNVEYTVGYYAAAEGKAGTRTVTVRLRDGRLGKVLGGERRVRR